MRDSILARIPPPAFTNHEDPFWLQIRASEGFLDLVFQEFFSRLNLPNLMRKTDYHQLAALVRKADIDAEVIAVLDQIAAAAARAHPVTE
jgi:hypothetical protein